MVIRTMNTGDVLIDNNTKFQYVGMTNYWMPLWMWVLLPMFLLPLAPFILLGLLVASLDKSYYNVVINNGGCKTDAIVSKSQFEKLSKAINFSG